MTERDNTTGLDHTWWRKYENLSGRWTSPDPYNGSVAIESPQSFNRYSNVQNDPVNFVDPSGLLPCVEGEYGAWCGGGGYWGPRSFGGNGWGSDPRPGRTIIRDAEPRTTRFGINRWEDTLFIIREPSMFAGWDWAWDGFQQQPRPPRAPNPVLDKISEILNRPPSERERKIQDCFNKKKAELDQARERFRNGAGRRILIQGAIGGGRGVVMGAVGGGIGGGAFFGVGAVPGAILGGVVGGVLGAGAGVLSGGFVVEPVRRAYYNSNYNRALEQARKDCGAQF